MKNKLISILSVPLFALGLSNCSNDYKEVHPDAFYDKNGDGKKEAFFISSAPYINTKEITYVDGRFLKDSLGKTYTKIRVPAGMGVFFDAHCEDGFVKNVNPTLSIGDFDKDGGVDIKLTYYTKDFPINLDQIRENVFPDKSSQ